MPCPSELLPPESSTSAEATRPPPATEMTIWLAKIPTMASAIAATFWSLRAR